MPVSVNKNLAASYILEDLLGRIANYGRYALLTVSGSDPFLEGGRIASTSELYSTAELYA